MEVLADDAESPTRPPSVPRLPADPRPYQEEALAAWVKNGRRGVVALPTGAGKTFLALMAMAEARCSAIVLVPTLELLRQWKEILTAAFGSEIGELGGGERSLRPITVSTYDSALIMLGRIRGAFGLLVADECHHLPSPSYRRIAEECAAPYRLGLSATPERADDGDGLLAGLIGEIVYFGRVEEMQGSYLSPYDTRRIMVPLAEDEAEEYRRNRKVYLSFLSEKRINPALSGGWRKFMAACFRSRSGREAWQAYRRQSAIMRSCGSKLVALWEIIRRHRREKIIVFTEDNSTAYAIGSALDLPVITHRTAAGERREMLSAFRDGSLPFLVSSKVLNEGVDVPEASVGVVVSGSGSVREHVQRLGRVLRKAEGKRAVLYELVSKGTAEIVKSNRRRKHGAYQKSAPL